MVCDESVETRVTHCRLGSYVKQDVKTIRANIIPSASTLDPVFLILHAFKTRKLDSNSLSR